ncbi:MAG: serine protease [Pirellulaceae bacterium]|nr:MAG: serine protease [Pirellulaceae bacterium]
MIRIKRDSAMWQLGFCALTAGLVCGAHSAWGQAPSTAASAVAPNSVDDGSDQPELDSHESDVDASSSEPQSSADDGGTASAKLGKDRETSLPDDALSLAAPRREELARQAVARARDMSLAFRLAAEKAMPSVVKILCRTREQSDSPILDVIGGSDEQVFDSVGSGVIVSEDGIVLTNHHVIEEATRIEVRLPDGREFGVRETKSDPRSDLAIIRLDTEERLPMADLGSSRDLHVGDWVLAIGSPFTLDSSVSAGIISGTGRYRQLSSVVTGQFIQTDAAINPGNSGGPLLDLDGRVIGINTAISTRTGAFQGIGFAIPIDRAKWIMSELLEYGEVRRAFIGVGTAKVPYAVARQIGLGRTRGAMVNRLVPGYPGEKAGLQVGDLIVEFNGQPIDGPAEFAEIVQQSPIGEPLPIVVFRGGERVEMEVELTSRR